MKHPIVLGTLLAGTLLLSACGAQKAIEPTAETAEKPNKPDIVQLSPQAVNLAGITTITVDIKAANSPLQTVGLVKVNENQVFHISAFSPGRLVQDQVKLGDFVQAGQPLATIQNLDLAKVDADSIHQLHQNELDIRLSKIRWALAQKNLKREKRLLAEGISPQKDYMQAETEAELAQADLEGKQEHRVHIVRETKALLSAYGVRPTSPNSETIQTLSPITAPRAGVITQKNVTLGDMVTPDKTLFEVANLSQLWLDLTVYPKDLSHIHTGQAVTFQSDSLPGKTFSGRIDYLPPAASTSSQTFTARANLTNKNGLLRPGMFGIAHIQQPSGIAKPFLPESAVQTYGKDTFVFLDLGQGQYRKVSIQLGIAIPGGYLVESTIHEGDRVVSKGSFNLKAEMLKSQFGEKE
jgi:cobalt-zinc-cadmium efflux system membrane fusion protein